ncbi:hypothetical protein J6590_101790, partial [Homalodisca vitripennis]
NSLRKKNGKLRKHLSDVYLDGCQVKERPVTLIVNLNDIRPVAEILEAGMRDRVSFTFYMPGLCIALLTSLFTSSTH